MIELLPQFYEVLIAPSKCHKATADILSSSPGVQTTLLACGFGACPNSGITSCTIWQLQGFQLVIYVEEWHTVSTLPTELCLQGKGLKCFTLFCIIWLLMHYCLYNCINLSACEDCLHFGNCKSIQIIVFFIWLYLIGFCNSFWVATSNVIAPSISNGLPSLKRDLWNLTYVRFL
jgi:hypothetical protein